MARIRTVKPEFFTSPDTARASVEARLLYIALWCLADDYGIGEANLNQILAAAFPEDDQRTRKEVQSLCKEVADAYGTEFYTVRGRHFYAIPSWDDHQKTQRRSQRRNPGPDDPDATPDLRIYGEQGSSESTQGSSESTQGNEPPGTGEQGNRGTGEQGSAATGEWGRSPAHAHERASAPAREADQEQPRGPAVDIDGWKLVRDAIPDEHPQASRSALALEAGALIKAGTKTETVRAALELWLTKPHLGPRTLPSLVSEVIRNRHAPARTGYGYGHDAATDKVTGWLELAEQLGQEAQA